MKSAKPEPVSGPSVEFAVDVVKGGGVRLVSLNQGVAKVCCQASEMLGVMQKVAEAHDWASADAEERAKKLAESSE